MSSPGVADLEPVEAACARMAGRRVDRGEDASAVLAKPPHRQEEEVDRLAVGDFSLIRLGDGTLWILRGDVEALQVVDEERLVAWLEKYWEGNR